MSDEKLLGLALRLALVMMVLAGCGGVPAATPPAEAPTAIPTTEAPKATPTAEAPTATPAAPPETLETRSYFPFDVGSSWTYVVDSATEGFSNNETPAIEQSRAEYSETVMSVETGLGNKAQIVEVRVAGNSYLSACSSPDPASQNTRIWYVMDDKQVFQACSYEEAKTIASAMAHGEQLAPSYLPLYVVPMQVGSTWPAFPDVAPRDDEAYQWFVESKADVDVPAGQFKDCYRVFLATLPDSTVKWLCKGIGLVAWEYEHHGQVNTQRAELTTYKTHP